MKDLCSKEGSNTVREEYIPVSEVVLLLKHTQSISSAMAKLLAHHHSVYNKNDDDTSKEIQETLVNQQVAKTAQDIFIGIRFVGSAAKAHMIVYDKQTIKRLYKDVRRGSNPLGGYEDLDPQNSYEFSLHFWASNK